MEPGTGQAEDTSADQPVLTPDEAMQKAMTDIASQSHEVSPFIFELFTEEKFFASLPAETQRSPELLGGLLLHSSRFDTLLHQKPETIFGEVVQVAETTHADGRIRHEEEGPRIKVDDLREAGIDPSKVLFFRLTQPSDQPKPEYYWTTDYGETMKGLRMEVSEERRRTAIILVADLATINQNEGLIRDRNDDNGLAVRQIGLDTFNQSKAIARVPTS